MIDDKRVARQEVLQRLFFEWGFTATNELTFGEELLGVPAQHQDFVLDRLYRSIPSSVFEDLVFVQKWVFRNYWNLPSTLAYKEPKSVPCRDFPLHWADQPWLMPRLLGWREKLDGIPYLRDGEVFRGDETIEVPKELRWVESFERIGNTCFILSPYVRGTWAAGMYTFVGHEWRADPVHCLGEGVMLLFEDANEYRLKRIPTTEVDYDGMVMEVQLESYLVAGELHFELGPIAPRPFGKAKTETEAMRYLSSQATFGQVELHVAGTYEELVRHDQIQIVGKGDTVSLSYEGLVVDDYWNKVRVATSAKALVQSPDGRVLLVKEGRKGWDFPGGKYDHKDEKPSHIMRREFREEVGLDLLFGDWKNLRRADHYIAFLYHIVLDPALVAVNDRCAWFTPRQILEMDRTMVVSWFEPLFRDLLRPGAISADRSYIPLVLANKGDRCYTPCTTVLGVLTDYAWNLIVSGIYVHDVHPTPSHPFMEKYRPVDWAQVPKIVRNRSLAKLNDALGTAYGEGSNAENILVDQITQLNAVISFLQQDRVHWGLHDLPPWLWIQEGSSLRFQDASECRTRFSEYAVLASASPGSVIIVDRAKPRLLPTNQRSLTGRSIKDKPG